MNAILVSRITNNDVDKLTAQLSQHVLGKSFCTRKKMNILRVIDLVETGTQLSRKSAFNNMMDELSVLLKFHTHEPLNLVVYGPDRLSRKQEDLKLLNELEKEGSLKIHYFR